jgi:uncharacterized tellurite resistance protein B-like protein
MNLPRDIAQAFRQERKGEPVASARAIYDLDGNLGGTHVVADAQAVMLFSQPLNGPATHKLFLWRDIPEPAARLEATFAFLELRTKMSRILLQFSPWEAPVLRKMVALWRKENPVRGAQPVQATGVRAEPSNPEDTMPPLPSPLTAFCAAVQDMIQCDGRVETAELNFLSRCVPDPAAIRNGQEYFERAGRESLRETLTQALNEDQRRCLLANLTAVAMVDGTLDGDEQELLDQYQTAMGVGEAEKQRIFQALMSKNNLAVFAAPETGTGLPDQDGLTPLMAYCASLLALMACDREALPAEEELLTVTVPYSEDITLGRDYLGAYGLDHLLGRLQAVLNPAQSCCLLANLVALSMEDGLIRTSEQELLERFQKALGISNADYETLYDVLLLKNNLSIFAEPATLS